MEIHAAVMARLQVEHPIQEAVGEEVGRIIDQMPMELKVASVAARSSGRVGVVASIMSGGNGGGASSSVAAAPVV